MHLIELLKTGTTASCKLIQMLNFKYLCLILHKSKTGRRVSCGLRELIVYVQIEVQVAMATIYLLPHPVDHPRFPYSIRSVTLIIIKPYTTHIRFLTPLQQPTFENIVDKGDIAHNELILHMPQCFQLFSITLLPFIECLNILRVCFQNCPLQVQFMYGLFFKKRSIYQKDIAVRFAEDFKNHSNIRRNCSF